MGFELDMDKSSQKLIYVHIQCLVALNTIILTSCNVLNLFPIKILGDTVRKKVSKVK